MTQFSQHEHHHNTYRINGPAFLDCIHDVHKVVVRDHHVGGCLGHTLNMTGNKRAHIAEGIIVMSHRASDAHGDADISFLQSGRVIHTVTYNLSITQ